MTKLSGRFHKTDLHVNGTFEKNFDIDTFNTPEIDMT